MSRLRKIKISIKKDIAKKLFKIKDNAKPRGINMPVCEFTMDDIVGYKNGEIYYDDMYVNKYKDIMKEYICEVLSQQGYNVQQNVVEDKVVLLVS